jgi:hypothetical protein
MLIRIDPTLDRTVVLLQAVVEVRHRPVLASGVQRSCTLELSDRGRGKPHAQVRSCRGIPLAKRSTWLHHSSARIRAKPNCLAINLSTILFGRSRGKVQFLKRCGMTV